MQVQLIEKNKSRINAEIKLAELSELKILRNWKFNWADLAKKKNSKVYKIQTQNIEGLLMIQFIDDNFFEFKNIEVAPSNYGSKGKYINVAKLLISYACLLAFEFNKGPYQGYLVFISKGVLIEYYIKNYGAELIFRDRMQINPKNGLKLIKEHLQLEL